MGCCFTFGKKAEQAVQGDDDVHRVKVFSYNDLRKAAQDFSGGNKIGEGGFGSVFRGMLKDGTVVAVKVLSATSRQGIREFLTELTAISDIKHENLVTLIGCCAEGSHRILVYNYLENNSLAQTLLGTIYSNIRFNWQARVKIAVGVARGLAFLHEEIRPPIIHRDIKASNILLDKDLTPKISDFGLARLLPPNATHVSTRVASTLGYLAPEYAIRGQVTKKSDIYSYGVLLLEIVSGRCNTNTRLPSEDQFLLERTWGLHEEGRLEEIIDIDIGDDLDVEEACRFLKIGLLCMQGAMAHRPNMTSVVRMLTGEKRIPVDKITRPAMITDFAELKVSSKEQRSSETRSPTTKSFTTTEPSSSSEMSMQSWQCVSNPLLGCNKIEVQHSTLYSDLKSWIARGAQWQRVGSHHSCLQQAAQQLYGRDDIKKRITEEILLNRNGGNNCSVICIISEGGHGKTSLLHALHNDEELLDTFDMRIWIQMSAKFDREILFRKIIEFPTHAPYTTTDLSFLEEMVKEALTDKKFLILLDDADIEDKLFWTNVLEVLNAGAKGSAVVVATTCGTIGALTGGAIHSYRLGPLSEENSLIRLEQYAGKGHDIKRYPELVAIAKKFIARFGANPLNLKALGGLLCHTDTVILEQDKLEGNIISCLHLCHNVLPEHLKNCLAFCSLFPKGYIFDIHHTVLLWLSRGFVAPVVRRELEDVGIEYFTELMCRSFFQYSPSHDCKDSKFVMHDLIYDVVASVSRDTYFKSEDLLSSLYENILHLSLVSSQFQSVELMSKTEELKDLQTFLVVQSEWQPYKISPPTLNLVGLDDFFLKFTSLETLDLSHTDTEELPGSIVGLRNLQYLSVSNTSIRALPSELCCLSNLQTLEAKDCRFLTELPGDTKKLIKLRHLDVTKDLGYVQLPQGVAQLSELRTLPVFHASSHPSHCSVSELGNLQNLRGCLQLSGLENVKTGSKAQEADLKDKHHLKDLTLQWHDGGINIDDEDEDEDTENMAEQVLESLQPHTNLQELTIRGFEGSLFPAWMQGSSSLPNLVSLTLDSCCNCTQFPAIAQLPSLKFLGVRKMYDVKRLTNNTHGTTKFPSLELLNLWEMYGLEELFEASEGDCPRLHKVCISRCPDLKRLPCTPSLTELVLHCGHQLPDIPELESLVSLKIEGFHSVKLFGLPASAALPSLKKLEIRSCKELSSVDGLTVLTSVQRLKVAGCPKLVMPRTDSMTT